MDFSLTGILANWVRPALDIAILSFLIYKAYGILVKTQAIQLVKGSMLLVLIYAVAFFFQLTTLQWILSALAPGLFIAVAIVFQPELRKIFMRLGQGSWFRTGGKSGATQIDAVLDAAVNLSSMRRGALIAFVRNVGLNAIAETGVPLDCEISSSVILTIFAHDGPLHDGAILVQEGRILAAGCFLPLSEQQDIRKSFGTRHRAALGLSEEADSIVLVVSEETGALSLAYDSKLYYGLSQTQIRKRLVQLLDIRDDSVSRIEEDRHER